MNIKEFEEFYNSYKRGTYTKLVKQKTTGNFKKVTTAVVRFVNYYNIKTIKEKTTAAAAAPRLYELQIIPHVLKQNLNTKNVLLCAYATNHHRAHNKYYEGDVQITKEEYYLKSGEKEKSSASIVYNLKIDDVVSIGV